MFIQTLINNRRSLLSNCIGLYYYYAHGPLARVEIGNDQVQGIDYADTLQGWLYFDTNRFDIISNLFCSASLNLNSLCFARINDGKAKLLKFSKKGVNSETLDKTRDIGKDGYDISGNDNKYFAKDVFGYSLNYFNGDYTDIGGLTTANNFLADKSSLNASFATDAPDLYNGNIKAMVTTITNPTNGNVLPQLTAYKYDQLNRIKQMKAFAGITANEWDATAWTNMYKNTFSYDAMGNIETATANNQAGAAIDNQTYNYQTVNGQKVSNRLYAIQDAAAQTSGNDLLDQLDFDNTAETINTANNHSYSEIGELISNKQDSIAEIKWTVYGKIKEVIRESGCHKYNLKFDYDPSGNRVAKHVYESDDTWLYSEYYVRDAQGNEMACYKYCFVEEEASFKLIEHPMYGSSRVGTDNTEIELIDAPPAGSTFSHVLGSKQYELTNHLGSVLTTFTDRKIAHSTNGITIDYYTADITSAQDYYPFGMLMPGRSFLSNTYPNGYQGSMKDDEIADITGANFTTFYREGSTLSCTWWSIDPETSKTPWESPYVMMSDNPIKNIDPLGNDDYEFKKRKGKVTKKIDVAESTTDRLVKLNRKGEVKKVFSEGIQKGILKEGQNFKDKNTKIDIGNGVTTEGVLDFTFKLSQVVDKEISGYALSDIQGEHKRINLTPYKGNTFCSSTSVVLEPNIALPTFLNNQRADLYAAFSFHTHPGGFEGYGTANPSPNDLQLLKASKGIPVLIYGTSGRTSVSVLFNSNPETFYYPR